MKNTAPLSRRPALVASAIGLTAVALAPASALAAPGTGRGQQTLTPTETLAATPWKTTSAVDQDGRRVPLDDAAVANFVGWAYFTADGTYTMFNLDDSPKLRGEWTVAADGSTRWINARNEAGEVLFERVVPITRLDRYEFTYRVFPVAEDASVYYDIVHTPTNHVEPGTGGRGPGANNGKGTGRGEGGYHFNHGNAR